MLLLTSLTKRFFILRRHKSFILFSQLVFLLKCFTNLTQITAVTLEKITRCWNNGMIRIKFDHLSVRNILTNETVFSSVSIFTISILILNRRNINWKTLIWQIRIVWPCSKLHIVVFGVTVDWNYTFSIRVFSVAWASNSHWVIFLLIKVRYVHLSVFILINWLSIISTFGSGCRDRHCIILTRSFERIWNYLNRLLCSLIVSSV